MSITTQDIERLAGLARIEVTEEEKTRFAADFESILGYISEINSVSISAEAPLYVTKNITRVDTLLNEPESFTEAILENAPIRNGQFVEVQQVL